MNEIVIDGESLTFEQVTAVAYGSPGQPKVVLAANAKVAVERCAAAVDELLARGEIAYGITTGFGAFKDKIISRDEVELLQKNIVLSHAVGVGHAFDTPTVRAIMLIRANTLARGHSGIRIATIELILEFLNLGIHPVIPEKGSLGASGDLAPLAHFACVLIGEGKAEFKGEVRAARGILDECGLRPAVLADKEGLALTNGTTVMTAIGLIETWRSSHLAELADIAGALSMEALNGTVEAFDERIHRLRPHPRQIECAANMRRLLANSGFLRGHDPMNVQDAYTLRCIPQVHGACRDAIAYADWLLKIELNAVTDNPLIFIDAPGDDIDSQTRIEVISGGNFHGEPLALAFDYLAMALSEFGNISERRTMRLTDEASNAHVLPAFLTENGGLNSGFMIVQYTAAALCTENKILSHPASVDTIPSSANVEDHVSMGATAALKLRQIRKNLELILAIELLCAAQAVDLRRRSDGAELKLADGTLPVFELIRTRVPFIENDVYMKDHLDAVQEIVSQFGV